MPNPPIDRPTEIIKKKFGVSKNQAWNIRAKIAGSKIGNKIAGNGGLSDDEIIAQLEPLVRQRLKRQIIETDIASEKLAIMKRDHVPVEEVRNLGIQIGAAFSEFASSSISNWPAELAGRDEIQIRETLTRSWDLFIEQVRNLMKKI